MLIATVTTRARPHRCAVSLPVIETAMPARPATVKSTVGSGSHRGAPWLAHTAARNVTPQARSADNSQVWTVYPTIQPMAARLRSTGRKSSNRLDGALVAGTANTDGITVAAISTALKAVAPPSRKDAEAPAQLATRPAMMNETAPEFRPRRHARRPRATAPFPRAGRRSP